MPHVFVSYAPDDRSVAEAACAVLEARGLPCWIASRDVPPGRDRSAESERAVREAAVMVLIYSRNANVSTQVKQEVKRAVSPGIPIVPFRIEDVPASETLEFFISTPHWLDATTPPLQKHLEYLAQTVDALRAGAERGITPASRAPEPSGTPGAASSPTVAAAAASRGIGSRMFVAVIAVAVIAATGWTAARRYLDSPLRSWVGAWTADNTFQDLRAHWTLEIDRHQDYTASVETHDAGPIRFDGPAFTMTVENGQVLRGALRFEGTNTAQISGPFGSATWTRDGGTASAGVSSPVGTWTASRLVDGMLWQVTLRIGEDGRYDLRGRAEDAGRFAADGRTWHLYSTRGAPQQGTWDRIDERRVSLQGSLGAGTWLRQ